MASTTAKSYLSIRPGETKVLSKGSKILSVINYGNVQYTNTCADFSSLVENASCYNLIWGMSRDNYEAMDKESRIKYISILGIHYQIEQVIWEELDGGVLSSGNTLDDNSLTTILQGLIPQSLMKIHDINSYIPSNSGRAVFTLNFQTTPTIADTIEMYLVGNGYENGLYVKPVLSPDGCGESSST